MALASARGCSRRGRSASAAANSASHCCAFLAQNSSEIRPSTTYTITGSAAVTHTEMASAISKALGRRVAFIDVPPDAFAGALKAAGVLPWQVASLVEDYTHYARGEAELISSHVRDVTGVDPRDVGRFAEDYASAFAGS